MKFIYKYLIAILFFFSSDFYSQNFQESNILIKNTSADLDSKKGLLGIRLMKLTPDIIKEKSLKMDSGILVYEFGENSAAEKYGVKINDVIKSIDGKECKENNDVLNYIFEKSAGDKVNLVIDRDGSIIEIPVILRAITINESIELYKKSAFEKFDKGDYEGAILNCSKILELVPDNFTVIGMRAVSKINNSNFKEALMDLNYYINLKSTNENYLKILPQMYAERGFVNFKLKSEEDGYADIIKATSLGYNGSLIKDAMNLYSQSAQIKSDGGDSFGAIKDYNKILEIQPENYLVLGLRAISRGLISDNNGAIEDVNHFIKIKSENKDYLRLLPNLYGVRGVAYSQQDLIDKACEDFRTAISMGLNGGALKTAQEKIKSCKEYELLAKEEKKNNQDKNLNLYEKIFNKMSVSERQYIEKILKINNDPKGLHGKKCSSAFSKCKWCGKSFSYSKIYQSRIWVIQLMKDPFMGEYAGMLGDLATELSGIYIGKSKEQMMNKYVSDMRRELNNIKSGNIYSCTGNPPNYCSKKCEWQNSLQR
jgi:tetratricopeptide (TPR) repeat protein